MVNKKGDLSASARLEMYKKALADYNKALRYQNVWWKKFFPVYHIAKYRAASYDLNVHFGLCLYFEFNTGYCIEQLKELNDYRLENDKPNCARFWFSQGALEPRIKVLEQVIRNTEI